MARFRGIFSPSDMGSPDGVLARITGIERTETMIDKKTSPKGKSVRVTFTVPADVAARTLAVVGDFNGWDASKGSMKLDKKAGAWSKGISLKPGASYQFRYLVDGKSWRNDEQADSYLPNEFFSENGVVEL